MDTKKLLEIVDKNVDQQGLAKDMAAEYIMPKLDMIKSKIESGEIDLIPGTDFEKPVLMGAIDKLKALLLAGE